eukprot:jgi/Hompol1/2022/HPOL_002806-RA
MSVGLPAFQAPSPIRALSVYEPVVESDGSSEPLPLLFTPLKLRGVTLKNRIGVSPMCMYSAVDGHFNLWHVSHLSQYAIRGAGLVIAEATGVLPNGRISPHCPGLWSDDHILPLKQIADFCHTQGAKFAIQLAHAGRKANYYSPFVPKEERANESMASVEEGGWPDNIISASALKGWPTDGEIHAATLEQIDEVVKAFGSAARRANDADLDIVEIHGAHGYLINQFLSPLSNKRTDHYGGSFENRIRLLLEVVTEVRKYWPEEKPLFVRLSCSDWAEGGWTSEDTVKLSNILVNHGVDLIDCSSGGVVPQSSISAVHSYHQGWNVPFSEDIKKGAPKMLTAAVGGITEPQYAEGLLQDGKADLILMAREFLRNPIWVSQAADALGVTLRPPVQYGRAPPKRPAADEKK